MVKYLAFARFTGLLADTAIWHQLGPMDRLRITVGLILVMVLGMFMMLVVKAGAHMARGFAAAARRLPKSSLPDENDWARPTPEPRQGFNDRKDDTKHGTDKSRA